MEENKNLEAQKKPGKSWLFWIGLGLIVLALILIIWTLSAIGKAESPFVMIPAAWVAIFYILPSIFLGLFLILIYLFLRFRRRGLRIIFGLLILFLFFGAFQIYGGLILIKDLATMTKNESICRLIFLEILGRSECYWAVAKEKNNPVICDKIREEGIRYYCYREIAILTKDELICDKITPSPLIPWAKSECYEILAKEKKDPGICEKITNEKVRDRCKMEAK